MAKNINYFPSNLRFLRKASRLTQTQIADKLGKAGSLVNMWESGKRDATLDDVRAIAEYFNVSLSDIICTDLSLNYSAAIQTEKEKELCFYFRDLTSDQQQAVLTMVKGMAKV